MIDRYKWNAATRLLFSFAATSGAEANQFAAAFLMPESDIRHGLYGMSIEKLMVLKLHWKTSMQAILLRARDLNRLSDRGYRYYQITLSKRGWRSKEPAEIEGNIETPRLFRKLLTAQLEDLGYSPLELGQAVGIVPSELVGIMPSERPKLRLVT
jgi:Zn-dependent peptidase ImmA (M78 family)